jgi:hypothetical protein
MRAPVQQRCSNAEGEIIAVAGSGKGYREAFARFFEAPSREGLRDLLRENLGEANEVDFKREWPEKSKLAKHVLGLANFGGGCIVIGVRQEEGDLHPDGLSALTDKTEILSNLGNYMPDTLMRQVEILDFPYQESEYPKLKDKSFQVLFVEDDPLHLPFVAMKGGTHLRGNAIYIRRGVATEEANHEEFQRIINRRLETGYSSRREIDLRTHLEQLQVLYEQVSPYHVKNVFEEKFLRGMSIPNVFAQRVPNPRYPTEDYETFVSHAIARKKRRIERELDIEDIPAPDTR